MKILIAVASRHGGTHEIAHALARELGTAGHTVDVHTVEDNSTVEAYDAVVIGSAVYMGNWLRHAVQFVDRHQAQLAAMPVWLFSSSGPLGRDDPRPKGEPAHLDQFISRTGARGHKTFVGKLDKDELGFGERLIVRAVGAPDGDFRDWAAISVWTDEIAEGVRTTRAPVDGNDLTRSATTHGRSGSYSCWATARRFGLNRPRKRMIQLGATCTRSCRSSGAARP